MSLLWAIPPVAVSVGLALALVQLRQITDATADLTLQLRRLEEVRSALAEVRAEAARTRAALPAPWRR